MTKIRNGDTTDASLASLRARVERLEEESAHLARELETPSDVVRRQGTAIETLERQLNLLLEQAAEAQFEAGGQAVFTDKPPPHY